MDDAKAQQLEAMEPGAPEHRALLKRWYRQAGSWQKVADELPFDTNRQWVMKVANGTLAEGVSEERKQAIIEHMDWLRRDHQQAEEGMIYAIQAIERMQEELSRIKEVIHRKADRLLDTE